MFGGIRAYIGNYYFRKDLQKTGRDRKLYNLQTAKKIGILYTLETVPDYEIVSEFVTQLQHDRKEVKALGFVKDKNLVSRFLPKLSYDFFSSRDLNLFYLPGEAKVRDFIAKEFDLLIDLSMKDLFPLRYISGLSMSLCRVGRYSERNAECYDFMIDVPANSSLREFIQHVTHYLTLINNEPKAPFQA